MDLDITIKGTTTDKRLLEIANEILEISTDELFVLSAMGVEDIREVMVILD
jgi:hypothetical protein